MSKSQGSAQPPSRNTSRVTAATAVTATFETYYQTPHNAIVEPDRFDHYLIRRWLPTVREDGNARLGLGPLGFAMVKVLRNRCFYNRTTGVLRNECDIDLEELARACSVSRATIVREMKNNTALAAFISRVRRFRMVDGRPRKDSNRYRISMDDPIHPDDMAEYERLLAEYSQEQGGPLPTTIIQGEDGKPYKAQSEPKGRSRTSGSAEYKAHFEPQSTSYKAQNDSLYLSAQNEPLDTSAQNEPTLEYLLSEGLFTKDSDTPAAGTPSQSDPLGDEERATDPAADPETIAREVRASLLTGAWSQAIADVGQSAGAATRRMLLPHLQLVHIDDETGETEVLCPSDAIRDQARKHTAALEHALGTHLARSVAIRLITTTGTAGKEQERMLHD